MLVALVVVGSALVATVVVSLNRVRRTRRELARATTEQERCEREIAELSRTVRHDALTDLLNRVGFLERLDVRLERSRSRTTVLYLDLDRFKTINDTLGHAAGDQLLHVIGRRIARVVGADGDAARIGGDEFAIALDGTSTLDHREFAERLSRSIVEPVEISGRLLRVSSSIGVAEGPWEELTSIAVLGFADQALQLAKAHGRDRIEVFSPEMRSADRRRAEDEIQLRRALDRGEIQSFFRPEIDVNEGRLIGAEIVARWIRDDGTVVDEDGLLDVARDANTVERLAVALAREARPFLRRLELLGLPEDFRFRLDVPRRCTPRAWRDGQIAAAFVDLDLDRITLDVTGDVFGLDPTHAADLLADLRTRGARVALRDLFDLGVLGSVEIDELRLAGPIVHGRRDVDDALLDTVTELARRLGLDVSAGDTVSVDDSHRLTSHGCRRQSGSLFGDPVSAEELAELVEKDLVNHLFSLAMP